MSRIVGFKYIKPVESISSNVRAVYDAVNESDMSLDEISAEAGVSTCTMRRWIKGERRAHIDDVEAVLKVCGYELEVMKL